ncbi:MAG: SGNH/GDSL hydrolase family protein [Clostridia bacterium]|nr:SGNH/GDSL hydrolase family protein [Clostridia bacterium]
MKSFRKILSVALALVFALGCFSLTASAKSVKNYLVLGDSIGVGQGLLNPTEACYGKVVADTNGYKYKNYAVGGYTTSNLLGYMQVDFVDEAIREADIISLSTGGNDFLMDMGSLIFSGWAFGDFSKFDEIAEKFYNNFSKIIKNIKSVNPDVVILVQNLYNPRYDLLRDIFQEGVDRLNAGYSRYLKNNPGAFYLVDVASAFEGNKDLICIDCVHPSAEGNLLIAKLVLKKLYSLGLGSSTTPVVKNEGIDIGLISPVDAINLIECYYALAVKYILILLA